MDDTEGSNSFLNATDGNVRVAEVMGDPTAQDIIKAWNTIIKEIHPKLLRERVSRKEREFFTLGATQNVREGTIFKIADVEDYNRFESDYLTLNDQQATVVKVNKLPPEGEPLSREQLQLLTWRVLVIHGLRSHLSADGKYLPETPALKRAVDLISAEMDKPDNTDKWANSLDYKQSQALSGKSRNLLE